jgi:hypothetical protein
MGPAILGLAAARYRARHPDRHKATQRRWGLKKMSVRRAFSDWLKSVPCMDCGQTYHPHVMEFDHRDPEGKSYKPEYAIRLLSLDHMQAELMKCDLVCANCHRMRGVRRKWDS